MRIRVKPEPYCPECGTRMVLRSAKSSQGWDSFWGCNRYPSCKGSRNIAPDGRPEGDNVFQRPMFGRAP